MNMNTDNTDIVWDANSCMLFFYVTIRHLQSRNRRFIFQSSFQMEEKEILDGEVA